MKRMKNPPHPGDFIWTEILVPRELSITEAAKRLRIPHHRLLSLINREIDLTVDLALRFNRLFKIDAETLLRMQKSYDLALRRRWEQVKKDLDLAKKRGRYARKRTR